MQERSLSGLVAVVAGGAAFADELALGLADHGARVEVVAVDGATPSDLDAAFDRVVARHGSIGLVVIPVVPVEGPGPVRAPLSDLDAAGWARACGAPLRAVRRAMVAAHRALARPVAEPATPPVPVVLVGPTAAITGEAGLVGYGAAAEGAHAMAKSCARTWGRAGVAVQWVSVPTDLLTGAPDEGPRLTLWEPALGHAPTTRVEVAATIAALAQPTMAAVTGANLTVDGGVVLHA